MTPFSHLSPRTANNVASAWYVKYAQWSWHEVHLYTQAWVFFSYSVFLVTHSNPCVLLIEDSKLNCPGGRSVGYISFVCELVEWNLGLQTIQFMICFREKLLWVGLFSAFEQSQHCNVRFRTLWFFGFFFGSNVIWMMFCSSYNYSKYLFEKESINIKPTKKCNWACLLRLPVDQFIFKSYWAN